MSKPSREERKGKALELALLIYDIYSEEKSKEEDDVDISHDTDTQHYTNERRLV